MELKCVTKATTDLTAERSNRTFMELKYHKKPLLKKTEEF